MEGPNDPAKSPSLDNEVPTTVTSLPETDFRTYGYQPLPSKGFFRLLELFPDQESAPIKCALSHHLLNNSPTYEALSYTWGDEADLRTVTINRLACKIRRNLNSALRRLRLPDKSRMLWADAVCIDQKNIPERNNQVSMMQSIYANAAHVLVWLGELDSEEEFSHQARFHIQVAFSFMDHMAQTGFDGAPELAALIAEPATEVALKGVFFVLQCGWFLRAWVLQEIALAKSATVHCGPCIISWNSIEKFNVFLAQATAYALAQVQGHPPKAGITVFELINSIKWVLTAPICMRKIMNGTVEGNHELAESVRHDLMRVLTFTAGRLATDPRDRIFAYLGLGIDSYGIQPDYALTPNQLFTKVTKSILLASGNLDVFTWKTGVYDMSMNSEAPSWVVDFETTSGPIPLTNVWSRGTYNASRVDQQKSGEPMVFDDDSSTLRLRGVSVDKIDRLGDPGPINHEVYLGETSLRDMLPTWKSLADFADAKPYVGGGSRREAFWKTIHADMVFFANMDDRQGMLGKPLDMRLSWLDFSVPPENSPEEDMFIYGAERRNGRVAARRFFVTQGGYFGLAPKAARIGDLICVLLGGRVPYVLRSNDRGEYILVGEWYVKSTG